MITRRRFPPIPTLVVVLAAAGCGPIGVAVWAGIEAIQGEDRGHGPPAPSLPLATESVYPFDIASRQEAWSGPAHAVTVGDVDGDGDPDLVVCGTSNLQVLLNPGALPASFVAGPTLPIGAIAAELSDLDRDGTLDLVVASETELSVWSGNGAGGFSRSTGHGLAGRPTRLAVADVDFDGATDAVIALEGTASGGAVAYGNAAGGLDLPTILVGVSPARDVVVLDLDGDAHQVGSSLDAAFVTADGRVEVVFDLPLGGAATTPAPVSGATAVASTINDYNADRDQLVVTLASLRTTTLETTSAAPSELRQASSTGGLQESATMVCAADLSFDDHLEHVSVERSGAIVVAPDWGRTLQRIDADAAAATLADLDGDGAPDLVAVGPTGVTVWLNGRHLLQTQDVLVAEPGPWAPDLVGRAAVGDLLGSPAVDLFDGTVWEGDGTGSFTPATAPAAPPPVGRVFLVNLDGDGDLDGITANDDIAVMTNAGDGTFTVTQRIPTSLNDAVAIADFDGDGRLDLLSDELYKGNLSGVFSPVPDATPQLVQGLYGYGDYYGRGDVVAEDLDGDGDVDAAVSGDPLRVWRNDGGTFTDLGRLDMRVGNSRYGGRVAAGDLDGDGDADLVSVAGDSLYLWENTSTPGSLTVRCREYLLSPLDHSVTPASIDAVDLDDDGDLDLVGPGGMSFVNLGSWRFTPTRWTELTAWADSSSLEPATAVDIDGDGDLDLIHSDGFLRAQPPGSPWWSATWARPRLYNDSYDLATRGTAGDFDDDGYTDAALVIEGRLTVFMGSRGGPVRGMTLSLWANAGALIAADVNGDRRRDLVEVGNPSRVWIGNGGGAFAERSGGFSGVAGSGGAGAADLDGDGDLDLVLVRSGASGGAVYSNDGTGRFAAGQALSTVAHAVAVGDFTGDGLPDALLGADLWTNTGGGSLARSTLGTWTANSIAAGHLNGDSHLDFVVGGDVGQPDRVFHGTGGGAFTEVAVLTYLGTSYARWVQLSDLDQDGDLDLLVISEGRVEVALNDGTGSFATPLVSITGRYPYQRVVVCGDFFGEGRTSLIANLAVYRSGW